MNLRLKLEKSLLRKKSITFQDKDNKNVSHSLFTPCPSVQRIPTLLIRLRNPIKGIEAERKAEVRHATEEQI